MNGMNGFPVAAKAARQPRVKQPGGPSLTQDASRQAKQIAAAILEVLAGARTPQVWGAKRDYRTGLTHWFTCTQPVVGCITAAVLTPFHFSCYAPGPEQANLNNLDVDTRSDVYSLGELDLRSTLDGYNDL